MAISTNSIIRCDIMYQLHLESVIWQVCGCQKKRDDNTTIMFTCTLCPNPFLSPIEGTNSLEMHLVHVVEPNYQISASCHINKS